MKMKDKVKPLTDKEIGLLNEMKGNCLNGSKYKDEKAKDKFYMLCHLEDFVIKHDDLLQENQKYKEAIDKAIEFTNKKWGTWCTHHLEYMSELQNILKEVE